MNRRFWTPGFTSFIALLVVLAAFALAMAAIASARAPDCDRACDVRVQKRVAHEKWRATVRAYGPARLEARMRCESGGHGGYSLYTTGNSFYFAHQYEPRAWYGAGGRQRGGLPVGVWSKQPSRLEQDYRAVIWERKHGGDPWPHCP